MIKCSVVHEHQDDSLGREETRDVDWRYLPMPLMADSRAGASNDEERGEWVLEDWME